MGHTDLLSGVLFDQAPVAEPEPVLSPQEKRAAILSGSAAARSEYTQTVPVQVDGYRMANQFINGLIGRAERTKCPGGFFLLGNGGLGKSFILNAVHKRHPPSETQVARRSPVLTLSFASCPAESDILLTLLLQLGQNPDTLRYQKNSELEAILLDALLPCEVRAILFDESHHLWLNSKAKRIADRKGGRLGDFLKRFYDRSGVAYVFAGTPGLEEELLAFDSQASTRWSGIFKLQPFAYDDAFVGLLCSLDKAIPMTEEAGLGTEEFASKLFDATKGNFRLLKRLLAEAVFIAAKELAPRITFKHLARAHFLTFCTETTPFGAP